jgi:hypothetical protein
MRPRSRALIALLLLLALCFADRPAPTAAARWRPTPGTSWQIQYTGTLKLNLDVDVYDLDLFDLNDSPADEIGTLHAQGRRVICYFSAGTWEDWRPDAGHFPPSTVGKPLADWPGESWLDIRKTSVRTIMQQRVDLAADIGCDAVDPDNVDGYTQDSGFPLTAANQLGFNKFLANEAHKRNLAVGLKNDLEQIPQLRPYFDFAVNESCFVYDECDLLTSFVDHAKAVFQIEYGRSSLARRICPRANDLDLDTLIKNLSLNAARTACR